MFSFLAGKWRPDIAIDLGTANTLVFVKGEGIVLEEPSVVAYQITEGRRKIIAVGEEAKSMLGRTPGGIETIRPLRDGVIADFAVAEEMIKHFFRRVTSPITIAKPRVIVCVPYGATPVEKRAIREAVLSAGARRAGLITEPIAAAIGSGINIGDSRGSMVVDIGGGTTDIAIISLGGIVHAASIRVAGNLMDEVITEYMRDKHNLIIGSDTAEQIKNVLGTAMVPPDGQGSSLVVRGRDRLGGSPKEVLLNQLHAAEALAEPIGRIREAVASVLQMTPPALSNDISATGVMLTGGGVQIAELDTILRNRIKLPVVTADDPLRCVAIGTGQALELGSQLRHIVDYES